MLYLLGVLRFMRFPLASWHLAGLDCGSCGSLWVGSYFGLPLFGFSPAVAPSLCLPAPWVLFLLAFGSTLGRSFCGFLWSSWAPFRILVLHLGDLSAIYILHYMIYYECPIGFTAYRFLTLAAAWVSAPTLWVTCLTSSLQKAAVLFTTVYIQPVPKI